VDPTGRSGFLELGGWDTFTMPEGHRLTSVSVNGIGYTSRLRVTGTVTAPPLIGESYSPYYPCKMMFADPGRGITHHRETWTPEDIAGLIVGVEAVLDGGQPGPTPWYLDGVWIAVETGLCGSVPANSYDFGNRLVGSGTDWSFRIYNAGTGPFSGDVENTGPFQIVSGGGHYELGAGQSRDVVVRYAPQTDGAFEETIGAPCGPTLRGTAVYPATDVPASLVAEGITRVAPQPFVERSSIQLGLSNSGVVRLAIHDVRGRRVRTLASSWLPAGEHRLEWDGRDGAGREVPAGVYFLKLETPSRTWTRTIAKVS
jgi:hypothetical protein